MIMQSKVHVLLVEDDEDTREVLRLILESDGIEVAVARDGLEALNRIGQLREQDPDAPSVIVLDYMMPRCSGPQFRAAAARGSANRRCPGDPGVGGFGPLLARGAPQALRHAPEAHRPRSTDIRRPRSVQRPPHFLVACPR